MNDILQWLIEVFLIGLLSIMICMLVVGVILFLKEAVVFLKDSFCICESPSIKKKKSKKLK